MSNKLKTFYGNLFQYHYTQLKSRDRDPEIMPIMLISFCQSTNILSLILIIILVFDIELSLYSLVIYFPVLFILAIIFNYYIFNIKKWKEKILNKNEELPQKMKIKSFVYRTISIWLPLLLIYIINEF